jgi:hypothetical protein
MQLIRRSLAALLRLVLEQNYKPSTAPKLDIVPIQKALGLLDRFRVVNANQRLEPAQMPTVPNDVGLVFDHPKVLPKRCGIM